MKKPLVLFASAAVALTFAAPALAKPEFPLIMEGYLQLNYAPPCRLCHIDGKTSTGTLRTPFALSMRDRGFNGDSDKNLVESLDKLKNEHVDSDGDGTSDTDELAAHNDPNSPAKGAVLNDDPEGGCGMARTRGTGAWLFGLAVAAMWSRRRS